MPTLQPVVLPSDAEAIDEFIAQQAPHWLQQANAEQLGLLHTSLRLHGVLQARAEQLHQRLQALDDFATPLLSQALASLNLTLDVSQTQWRDVRLEVKPVLFPVHQDSPPTMSKYDEDSPLLQRALQNFTAAHAGHKSHFPGSGIRVGEQLLATAPEQFAALCRTLDLGGQYQRHLDEVFAQPLGSEAPVQMLCAVKRNNLAVQAQLSLLKGHIDNNACQMLLQLGSGRRTLTHAGHMVRVGGLEMLESPVHDVLVFEVFDVHKVAEYRVRQLLVYLPEDAERPLREYSGWAALATELGQALREADYQRGFLRRFSLDDAARLRTALKGLDHEHPLDLKLLARTLEGDPCLALAQAHIARIKNDAASLAVPTAAVDLAVYRRRWQAYENAGMSLLGIVAGFIPGVGELMLANLLVETLDEVYEGAQDWSHGHRSEALEHLFAVVRNVVVTGAVVAGGVALGKLLKRSAFVDGLQPVHLERDEPRLWSTGLQPYREPAAPAHLPVAADGLIHDGERRWLSHEGQCYEVCQQAHSGQWQLRHPQRPQAYAPCLEHNGEGAWRLPGEQPLLWQGRALLVSRLGPLAAGLSVAQCEQAAQIAGMEETLLRGVLVGNRPMPASLRDVLEYLQLDRRLSQFFAQIPTPVDDAALDSDLLAHARAWLQQGSSAALASSAVRPALREALPDLRGALLDFVRGRCEAVENETVKLLHRDFPTLPHPYIGEVLEHVGTEQLQHMQRYQRLPMSVAERARTQLQQARLTRAVLGLQLRNGGFVDTARLALNLLRRSAGWPSGLNLELREDSWFGRLIERQLAQADTRETRVLVETAGRYEIFTHDGYNLDSELAEPAGFFEAVCACLTPAQQAVLDCAGVEGPQRLQQALLTQALDQRERCGLLLGMAPPRPLLNRWHRLADGRVGYPLSGRGAGERASLVSSVRALYPSFSTAQVNGLLAELQASRYGAMRGLARLQRQRHDLDAALARWNAHGSPMQVYIRRRFADALRRCWRRESERAYDTQDSIIGFSLHFENLPLTDLPVIPASVNFDHVIDLSLNGTGLAMQVDHFLRAFQRLRWLDLGRCQLSEVPSAVAQMPSLIELYLDQNRIRISRNGIQRLSALSHLELLDLSDNPVGSGLDLSELRHLRCAFLRNTQLPALPNGLLGNPLLEIADLRQNNIDDLPEAFFNPPTRAHATIVLEANPLPAALRHRVRAFEQRRIEHLPHVTSEAALPLLLQDCAEPLRSARNRLWTQLSEEHGASDFLRLIGDLTGTAQFERGRADLLERVWQMLGALPDNTRLRDELFDLAAHPTTCVDSVIATFSNLEVRYLLHQTLARAVGSEAQAVLLQFARQLFRLDRLEQLARAEIARRRLLGEEVDEIEVDLAYRVGLARELDLPGQPTHMQFAAIAEVTPALLETASRQVREAEAGEALAQFVSQRDFWRKHLQEVHAERFSDAQRPFWERLEQLDEQQPSLPEGDYLRQMNSLGEQRETALDALALKLTREALGAHAT